MLDKKRRLFRLIEYYINDHNSKSVDLFYGNGAKIKIHSLTESITKKTLLFEVVVVLGEVINESVLDEEPADLLVREALFWFFPEYYVKTMVRWDS